MTVSSRGSAVPSFARVLRVGTALATNLATHATGGPALVVANRNALVTATRPLAIYAVRDAGGP